MHEFVRPLQAIASSVHGELLWAAGAIRLIDTVQWHFRWSDWIVDHHLHSPCMQGQSALRSVIAMSAAATVLYTPLLKRLTGVKNATVAAVITASPLAGALAAGAVPCPPAPPPPGGEGVGGARTFHQPIHHTKLSIIHSSTYSPTALSLPL